MNSKTRDYSVFPDDENGDVLWQMHQYGDDLTVSREIDFSVIFPTKDAAFKFAFSLLENEQKVSFSPYEENTTFPWQIQIHPVMVPSHKNISHYEHLLGKDAARFDGINDGWGCLQQDSDE